MIKMLFPLRYVYAIEAVVVLASDSNRSRPVNAKRLAWMLGVSTRYLEATLQGLVRTGLLKSSRGPRGGYYTAFDPPKVTLADLVKAIQTGDVVEEPPPSGMTALGFLFDAEAMFIAALGRRTVADLLHVHRSAAA